MIVPSRALGSPDLFSTQSKKWHSVSVRMHIRAEDMKIWKD